MSYQTCMSLFCRTQKKVFWKMLWNSKFFHFSFSLSVDAVNTKDTHEFDCIVCQMRKYCLVSQTWKLAKKQQKNCALWSCMKPSNQTEAFEKALAIFVSAVCSTSETQTALSFCQSLLFIGPCETLSRVTNTDESLTMCHNIWANERADLTVFDGSIIAEGLHSVRQGWALNSDITLPQKHTPMCQFFFERKKPASMTKRSIIFWT